MLRKKQSLASSVSFLSYGAFHKQLKDLPLVDGLSWSLSQLLDKVTHGCKLLLSQPSILLRLGHFTHDKRVKSWLFASSIGLIHWAQVVGCKIVIIDAAHGGCTKGGLCLIAPTLSQRSSRLSLLSPINRLGQCCEDASSHLTTDILLVVNGRIREDRLCQFTVLTLVEFFRLN